MSENRLGTIGLIHGYGHRAAHWDKLRPELEELGFDTIAVDLPADDPDATFDDYAQVAATAFETAIQNDKRIDLLAHSMGSQTVPGLVKILGRESVRSAIHISGSIGKPSDNSSEGLTSNLVPRLPIPRQRNTEDYRRATLRLEDGTTVLNPAKIRELLFDDCTPEDFIWALGLMRLQGKPKNEPTLEDYAIHGLHQVYILGDQDPIRSEDYVLEKLVGELGMQLVRIKGGHSPAIARPDELAKVVAGEIRFRLLREDTELINLPAFQA